MLTVAWNISPPEVCSAVPAHKRLAPLPLLPLLALLHGARVKGPRSAARVAATRSIMIMVILGTGHQNTPALRISTKTKETSYRRFYRRA